MTEDHPTGKIVVLAGSARSGTTWLQELINHDNQFCSLFEPFNSKKVEILSHWNYRQYLRSTNKSPEFISPTRQIFEGTMSNAWINKFNQNPTSRKKLIKDIRINLCLYWMHRNFSNLSVLLVLRHPCAVAHSRTRLGWNPQIQCLLSQQDLVTDFLVPYKRDILACNDIFQLHVYMWCIENLVPLTLFKKGEIHIVFYEHICQSTESELGYLFKFIDEPYTAGAENFSDRPSATSYNKTRALSERKELTAWKEDISGTAIAHARDICEKFGLDTLYGEDFLPVYKNDEILNLFNR